MKGAKISHPMLQGRIRPECVYDREAYIDPYPLEGIFGSISSERHRQAINEGFAPGLSLRACVKRQQFAQARSNQDNANDDTARDDTDQVMLRILRMRMPMS